MTDILKSMETIGSMEPVLKSYKTNVWTSAKMVPPFDTQDISFSELTVSTMTCAGSMARNLNETRNDLINIFAIAKYLELDSTIVGVKLVYAAGMSSVIRGSCRLSKRKKDFYNQVTFSMRLNDSSTLSYKIFHNGAIQLTGAHSKLEALQGCNYLIKKLDEMKGIKSISLASSNGGLLMGHDHLFYTWNGRIIGYNHVKNGIYINGEYLVESPMQYEMSPTYSVLESKKWTRSIKKIYTMDGEFLGTKKLVFKTGLPENMYRKEFEIIQNKIVYHNTIVGEQVFTLEECALDLLKSAEHNRKTYVYPTNKILHDYTALRKRDELKTEGLVVDDITVYNVNARFEGNFRIYRDKLWECFVKNGLTARFDSCSHLGVNLRYHYIPDSPVTGEFQGQCLCPKNPQATIKTKCGTCKIVSLLCFVSGKIVVTGLKSIEEAQFVGAYIKKFYVEHVDEIVQ